MDEFDFPDGLDTKLPPKEMLDLETLIWATDVAHDQVHRALRYDEVIDNPDENLLVSLAPADLSLIDLGMFLILRNFPCLEEDVRSLYDRLSELLDAKLSDE